MPKKLIIGLDVGGTKIQAGLISPTGRVLKKFRLPTEANRGKKIILANLEKCLAAVWAPGVASIGAGLAGLVDAERGVYVQGPNFPRSFRNVALTGWLKKKFGVPAAVDNDVHCFTLGEAVFGAGRGYRSVFGLTLGTGVGGGLTIDGRLYASRDNAAGEVGHLTLAAGATERCSCGRAGHFEALVAGPAQTAAYRRLTGKKLLPSEIEKLAQDGDRRASEVVTAAGRWLGLGIANVVQTLNPDIIVIGGGISRNRLLWPPLRQAFKQNVIFPPLRSTPIVRAALGDDANIIGAGLLGIRY